MKGLMKHVKSLMKNIPNIVENKDNYSWVQLNCFLKAIAIILESFQKGYFDIFLLYSSFFLIYNPNNYINKYENDFINFFNDFLSFKFGIYIKKIKSLSKDEVKEQIIRHIDSDFPVLVPTDLIGLYYDSQYLREHHRHYVIVKGYDLSRNLLFILDNMHVDRGSSPIYKDFVIKIDDLVELNQLFSQYEKGTIEYAFWSFQPIESESKIRNINDVLSDICNYFKDINDSRVSVIYNESRITEIANDKIKYQVALSNLKDVYYDILLKLLSLIGAKKDLINNLTVVITTLKKSWKKVSNKLIYNKYKNNNIEFPKNNLDELILQNINLEKEFRSQFIDVYAQTSKHALLPLEGSVVNLCNSIFTVENRKDALINIKNDNISFFLSEDRIFDTWIQYDNCPKVFTQVYFDKSFTIESQITIDAPVGSPYHTGLIAKLSDGSKLLYGNHRGCEISLFHPENTSNFVVKSIPINGDKIQLKLDINRNFVTFYYKDIMDGNWNTFYILEANNNAVYCGLFAKSWEKMEGLFIFNNIICNKSELNIKKIYHKGGRDD